MHHVLDWENMPDPFRHYEGVPVLDLPAGPPPPLGPALDVLMGVRGAHAARDGATFLSQLLFHSAAISASKLVPRSGYRYALRVNPSSGNLHPTEFHFLTRGLKDWPDGLYHYRPSSHMAEQRAAGRLDCIPGDEAPVVFLLTTIAWREAWKYRDRAYRYCLHDLGHAWQALALAAAAAGCESGASGRFADRSVASQCRLAGDEWPMLIVRLTGESIPLGPTDRGEVKWFGGRANPLSTWQVPYPRIEEIHAATSKDAGVSPAPASGGPGDARDGIPLPPPSSSARPFSEVVRTRRSALDFRGGNDSMSMAQLSAILAAACQPLPADFAGTRYVELYLYVHRVDGLEPGVYRYRARSSQIEQVRSGDQRVAAAGLSLGQDLAGNACIAFSMIADFDRAARDHGDRGYRYAHFEAGAIGQRLYLAAEALGLGATGIGAFYDEEVHRYLAITSGQVVYHFAIGYPVADPRLSA